MKRHGFTIWEALVVAIIIVLLAAILFPVFFRFPHGSSDRRYRCRSNLKKIALAIRAYREDYDGYFPVAGNARGNSAASKSWAGKLARYLNSPYIFNCPSDEGAKATRTSYAYNAWLGNYPELRVHHPSQVILNFEVVADAYDWTQIGTGPSQVTAATRHSDGANYSFVDGHVKWLKLDKITASRVGKGTPTFVPG